MSGVGIAAAANGAYQTLIGTHENSPMGEGTMPGPVRDPGGDSGPGPTSGAGCRTLPNGATFCPPALNGGDGNGNPGKNPKSGDSGNNSGSSGQTCSSTSPEFCTLSGLLGSQLAGGAPITPYLQDNNTPTVTPTQTTSTNASLAIVLFIIAGALGYYYYRKHGGASIHEAL